MKHILKKLNACNKAINWVEDRSIEKAINECPRGDWMLWLFNKLYPDDLQLLTLAKGHCANTVRHLMTDERSIKAVDVAIAFGKGKANREELNDAADYAAVATYAAASYAAAAANYAADAYAAAYVASAAAYAVAAAAADAKISNELETANICRKYLGEKLIQGLKEMEV